MLGLASLVAKFMSNLNEESSISIDICSFLGSANLFFVGILIAGISNFDKSIRVAILFLIVSAISFIFSALIYARSTGSSRTNKKEDSGFIKIGNSISEYLGVYPLICAIPVVINSVSDDVFIRASVTMLIGLVMLIYSDSKVSMVRRQFGRTKSLLLGAYCLLQILTASLSQRANGSIFIVNAAIFMLVMLFIATRNTSKI